MTEAEGRLITSIVELAVEPLHRKIADQKKRIEQLEEQNKGLINKLTKQI